ncbi:MAG: porin [Dinghuibacter sp.]|nr:porin [Dinghuibacter sp.]
MIALMAGHELMAQSEIKDKFKFSGYGELYYSYDHSRPANHEKAAFLYNHKRHNELNANLLVAKASYQDSGVRANLALMFGNYAEYNLASEPVWAQHIYEASIGVKLSKKENIWLDAGIMPSHIGFESAIGADCWTVTRSILAENSPYYETAIKLGYTNKKEKISVSVLLLNGWQKIKKPQGIQRPSFGMQLYCRASEKLVINYSNFIGTDKPDSVNATRIFHNIYGQYTPTEKLGIIIGFDAGRDRANTGSYGIWYSPAIIFRYRIRPRLMTAIRAEHYNDKKQIIILTGSANGFQTSGYSANIDYQINKTAMFRVEGKLYKSRDKIFSNNSGDNISVTGCLTIKL